MKLRSRRSLLVCLLILTIFLISCRIGSSTPATDGPLTWKLIGYGDCEGHDDGGTTEGALPDDAKALPGYTAVCWDSVTYNNQIHPGRAFCTYKKIEYGDCTGGENRGEMYTAVAE